MDTSILNADREMNGRAHTLARTWSHDQEQQATMLPRSQRPTRHQWSRCGQIYAYACAQPCTQERVRRHASGRECRHVRMPTHMSTDACGVGLEQRSNKKKQDPRTEEGVETWRTGGVGREVVGPRGRSTGTQTWRRGAVTAWERCGDVEACGCARC